MFKSFALQTLSAAGVIGYALFEVYENKATIYTFNVEKGGVVVVNETVEYARTFYRTTLKMHGTVDVSPNNLDLLGTMEDGWCRAGQCDHYTCTEGASVDNWVEPEPTRWDYNSEAYGATVADAEKFLATEGEVA